MRIKEIYARIRHKASSIRMRTLIYFVIGMLITLIVSYCFGYSYMYAAVDRINTDSIHSEISQIDIGLDNLHDSINRLTTQTLENEYFQALLAHNSSIDAELVYAINGFKAYTNNVISHFVYIHSVYLFMPDGRAYCFSNSNTRFLFDERDPKPSQVVQNRILSHTGKEIAYIGGVSTGDFPVQGVDGPDFDLVSAVYCAKNTRIVFNLYAGEIESCYSAIASDDNCMICVLSADGTVVSSLDKEKVGKKYAFYSPADGSVTGAAREAERRIFAGKPVAGSFVTVIELYSSEFMNKFIIQERIMLIIFLLGLVCTCFLFELWMRKALSPMDRFIRSMELAGQGEYSHDLPENGEGEISVLARCYNRMLKNLQILTRNKERAEREKTESELTALRNQINPHFLYNTLTNIRWMALIDGNERIAASIMTLAKYIAPMYQENGTFCTLREELYTVELYSQIMNARFEGGVALRHDIDRETEQALVPRFILQPIIENSFTHGFPGNSSLGVIAIDARRTDMGVEIRIEDNGIGISDDELIRINEVLLSGALTKEIGLTNTNRRLRLGYGEPFGVRLEHGRSGTGLAVVCLLPHLS